MSKSVNCSKCKKTTKKYNWFKMNFSQPQYTFNGTQNISRFCLCHSCSRELSRWMWASEENYLQYSRQ